MGCSFHVVCEPASDRSQGMTGILSLIAASFLWSILDGLRKLLANKVDVLPLTVGLLAGQSLFFAVLLLVSGTTPIDPRYWQMGLLCLIFGGGAALGIQLALKISSISTTIPMLSLTPAFTAVIEWLFFDVDLSSAQLLGLGISASGAALLSLSEGWSKSSGAYVMLVVALLLSASMACDKEALLYNSPLQHALLLSSSICAVVLLALVIRREIKSLSWIKRHRLVYVSAVTCFALAVLAQLFAVQYMSEALVEAVKRSIGIFGALCVGAIFFQESLGSQKLGSGVLLLCGLLCLLFL